MRLVTFASATERRLGALRGEEVVDLNRADPRIPNDIVAVLEGGAPALDRVRRAVGDASTTSASVHPLSSVKLLAPIPRPPKIVAIGRNYADHVAEAVRASGEPNERPSVFIKVSSAVIASGEPIVRPTTTECLDYEGELAVVIGEHAKAIKKEDALRYIAGYTIFNDVSARDLQYSKTGGIILGKNFDTSAPMGPYVALSDEIPDPSDIRIRTWINDELRQDASTRDLIFDVPTILWYITQQLTLEPGDVVATGTPAGVGMGFEPPKWLQPGDRIRIEIQGLGTLENPVTE